MTAHKQSTGGNDYTTEYTYNLSGGLIEETYPSGRKVKNTLDADGALSLVETKPSGGSYATRAGSFTYNPAGAVTSMQLGNGRWESTVFNNRLQPTQIALGTTQTGTGLLKLNYSYYSGTATTNNGNVMSQTITVPGVTHPFIQTYSYDALNRLESATETQNLSQTWAQKFTFDRYGNRNFDAPNTTTLGSCSTAVCNPAINASDNRIASGQGYSFDNAGNTTVDAEGRQSTYDAENKQVLVRDAYSAAIGTYFYDGDGKRVKKTSATNDDIIFIYNAAGKLVEERNASTGALQTSYVYAGSRLLSTETSSGTSYLTNDHLGSPRINTDVTGTVTARHDYHPFGEEILRSGYGSDVIRKQFTGYERDGETGLDFAQARYFNSGFGRFSSPDPYSIVLEIKVETNPEKAKAKLVTYLSKAQQWNRYTYVMNNPLLYVDPSGEILELTGTQEEQDKAFARIMELCGEKCSGRLYIDKRDGRTLVKYFDNKGGLAGNAGKVGAVLEQIINSDTLVQLQVTNKTSVMDANGGKVDLSIGAKTEIISSKQIQIFISDSVSMSTISDSQWVLGTKAVDGSKLVNTATVVLAHEFGHAWGAINDNTFERYNNTYRIQVWKRANILSENNNYSLIMENWQRDRLGLKPRANH